MWPSATAAGEFKAKWLGRSVKLTSYCWDGTIGGYVGSVGTAPANGKTYKLTDFRPTDLADVGTE